MTSYRMYLRRTTEKRWTSLWNAMKHKRLILLSWKGSPTEKIVGDGIVMELKIPPVVRSSMKEWFEWKCRWNGKGSCQKSQAGLQNTYYKIIGLLQSPKVTLFLTISVSSFLTSLHFGRIFLMYLFSFHLSIFPWQLSLFTTNSAECMGKENISWKWKLLPSL